MNSYIAEWFEKNETKIYSLMRDIWEHPELSLKEYYACELMRQFAVEEGFESVETHAAEDWANQEADRNTMIASWGSGKPVIAIVGELDALPDLGQRCVPKKEGIEGPGHGCGHNTMSGGAAAAAAAVRYAMEKMKLSGTIKLIQAPGEEIGRGKSYLGHHGVFDDVDMTLMWHPAPGPLDFCPVPQQVAIRVLFEFHGTAAHAAGIRWDGRSALDAVQLMNIGCEFLREHAKENTWIHYNIVNGGAAPNIIPDYASARYMFRSMDDYDTAVDLLERGIKCAKGAALMTDTTFEYKVESVVPQYYYTLPLCKYMCEEAGKVPPLIYEREEYEMVRQLYRQVNHAEPPEDDEELLPTKYLPYREELGECSNCTDAADMTYFGPSLHFQGLARPMRCPGHHWSATFCAGTSIGMKPALYAYKIIAQAAVDAFMNTGIVDECWEAFKKMNIPPHKCWLED